MPEPFRFSDDELHNILQNYEEGKPLEYTPERATPIPSRFVEAATVVIAGSGPIACAYARTILEKDPKAHVLMVEIGSQDSRIIGEHHKNSIKFQKDIDAFVNVIKGALQPVSVPTADTYIPTLVGDAWTPPVGGYSINFINPKQIPEKNLKACAVTRTVGGMATHWTCACPTPHDEELKNNPIPKAERDKLFARARALLNVHNDQYDKNSEGEDISFRHFVVKKALLDHLPHERNVQSLPLAVERRVDNPDYVTWTGPNTVLGDLITDRNPELKARFRLITQTRVTRLLPDSRDPAKIGGMLLRDLENNADVVAVGKTFIVACGSIGTPQILANSGFREDVLPALGRNLSEQSLAFCQIVLKQEYVDFIKHKPEWQGRIKNHQRKHKTDPLPIPFSDPEPQVMIPYTSSAPWHCQVHRDAFSYGDVGPRADSRVVVDLRFFGKQEIKWENRVEFAKPSQDSSLTWVPGDTDLYGMPQATFHVQRSQKDSLNDQKMMKDLCATADTLGAYLPGSAPQFMEPGLALHITGTTRIGTNKKDSVADPSSRVHGFKNLWVGGNGCIPDSTACNPTLTSTMIALKGADSIVEYLKTTKNEQ